MTSYEFALKLNREVSEDEIDSLYDVGLDDAGIETGPLGTVADFNREAPSLASAIASAVRDIEKVPRLRAVGVQCDNMVTMLGIAERAGVSREAVRLWSIGRRGPGHFPKPVLITTGGEQVWDWEQVAPWIEQHQPHKQVTSVQAIEVRIFRAADRVLAARDALMSEPDDEVRHELERLLEDA